MLQSGSSQTKQGSHYIAPVLKGYISGYSRCKSGHSATSKMKQFVTIVEAFIISKIKTLYFQCSGSLDLRGLGYFAWVFLIEHGIFNISFCLEHILCLCVCVCVCVCVALNFITRQFSFRFCIILSYNCSLVFLTKKKYWYSAEIVIFFFNPNKDVYLS